MEIRHKQKIVAVSHAQRRAFVNSMVNTAVRAIIDSDDHVCRVHGRVPTGDGTIFTGKNEQRGCRSSMLCHWKGPSVVKHDAGWSAGASVPRGRWNCHDQQTGCAILIVES